jgi:hypothetical protein
VGKVEADPNATFLRHGDRAPELVVPVVPAKHDVLPDHANSGSHGVAMETNEIGERHITISPGSNGTLLRGHFLPIAAQ